MANVDLTERAAFLRTALLLGLTREEHVVQWADEEIARSVSPLPVFVELATVTPGDVTALRLALFELSGDQPSVDVIHAILGLIDLASRRSATDTTTVLGQLRSMVKLPPQLVDDLRRLELESMRSVRTGDSGMLGLQVRQCLEPCAGREVAFLGS